MIYAVSPPTPAGVPFRENQCKESNEKLLHKFTQGLKSNSQACCTFFMYRKTPLY
jgi:hypothetical protein